jgi:hypothetical protein
MTQAVQTVTAALVAGMMTAYPDPGTRPIVGVMGPTDPPQRDTVLVGSSQVTPPNVACPSGRTYEVRAWAISAMTAPGAGDDSVDALLDAVLASLDAAAVSWSTAVRGVWADQYPSYVVTMEVVA